MKYRILLENKANGDKTEVIVPAGLPLEELSVKIKLEMNLPITDKGWHRFLVRGTTYMPDGWHIAEEEILWECDIYPGRYRASESIRIKYAFTTLYSTVTYIQDNFRGPKYRILCTLLQRI